MVIPLSSSLSLSPVPGTDWTSEDGHYITVMSGTILTGIDPMGFIIFNIIMLTAAVSSLCELLGPSPCPPHYWRGEPRSGLQTTSLSLSLFSLIINIVIVPSRKLQFCYIDKYINDPHPLLLTWSLDHWQPHCHPLPCRAGCEVCVGHKVEIGYISANRKPTYESINQYQDLLHWRYWEGESDPPLYC